MSKYKPHSNSLNVWCAECKKDITLHTKYFSGSRVLCGDCNEIDGEDEEEVFDDIM